MKKLMYAVVAVFAGLAVAGCGVDAAFDCHAICSRYSTCFDAAYDVGACETRCRSHSSDDTAYRQHADECSACIDNRACASAVFSCGAPCASVVP